MKKTLIQISKYGVLMSVMLCGFVALAQEPVVASIAKPTIPATGKEEKIVTEGDALETKLVEEKKEAEEGKFSVSGYLDSYYFTNFNKPVSRDNMGQSGVGRGFDRRVDQFQLGMVQTVFKYTNAKSEMVADLAYGPSAQYGNYGNVPVQAPAYGYSLGNDTWSSVIIKQAYFKYNATDKLSFIAGQFGTHIGYEYIDAPLNFFYSINHTFNSGIPFYHTGVKATYAFSDKVSLMLGGVNGFDYVHDNNRAKGLIGQLTLTPAEGLSIYVNYINSNESNADPATGKTPAGNFTVYDLNGGYQASEKLFLGYWFMYGTQKGTLSAPGTFLPADGNVDKVKSWYGANLYLTYAFSDVFSLGFRGEYFDNKSGARGLRNVDTDGLAIGASVSTYTLTGSFTLADGHLILKPELRSDVFNKLAGAGNEQSQQFMDAKGDFTKNGQTTLGMAAIYKF
jgi:Putative beta-barrel porin-2, OmpL-like. bbp2